MTESLQEFVDSRGVPLRVDRAAGVLRGVKLIGLESLNRRRYRAEALAAASALYEGAKVNVDHPKAGPLAPRDYRDRLGVIRQVEFRPGEGLFGTLHFNPKHALAEQLAWDAEHNPANVGFSHNVLAKLSRDGEQTVVEEITRVQSVDLVADPAATRGLFEQAGGAPATEADEVARLAAELQAAAAREHQLRRQVAVLEQLAAHGLLPPAGGAARGETIGAALYETLLGAGDDVHVEALIAERAASLRQTAAAGRPRSSEQMAALAAATQGAGTASDFARALRTTPR